MTLVQHGSDRPVFRGDRSSREPAGVAIRARQEKLTDIVVDDAWSAERLARQLRDEWRRERYARLKD